VTPMWAEVNSLELGSDQVEGTSEEAGEFDRESGIPFEMHRKVAEWEMWMDQLDHIASVTQPVAVA